LVLPKLTNMKTAISCLLAFLFLSTISYAKKGEDSLQLAIENNMKFMDSVEGALHWQSNTVSIANGIAKLNLSKDFKYLNEEQSNYVLHDLWGNPPRTDVLGMIFPASSGPFSDSSYAFIITFDEAGYVKDNDAEKINYDDMLTEMQKGETEENRERAKGGYVPIHMVGWAARPYYDKENRVLHWAKELRFGYDSIHTLNYEVRVLGRKGVLSLNAVATMSELELVTADINKVLKIPEFSEGNRYKDFNSNTDKVAEYGIGALVAGGILAKTGVFAVIGKFLLAAWKFIMIGIVAMWGAIKKFFTGRSKKNNYLDNVAKYKP
jgi:uncharacterized membrane-anchored protein